MTISLELDNRQYLDIEYYCSINNLTIQEYLTDIITEKHSLNKFGDLNEIIPVAIEESTVKAKKRGRPKKDIEPQIIESVSEKEQPTKVEVKETKQSKEVTNAEQKSGISKEEIKSEVKIVKPTVKRKRALKTL